MEKTINIQEKLETIWNNEYIKELPETISKRGFNYVINEEQKNILITGINPSFRIDEKEGNSSYDFRCIAKDTKYDTYWTSLKRILHNQEINLLNQTAYLDIFYFRERNQRFLREILKQGNAGVQFIVDQLNLTQSIVEYIIQPKLIIVKNKESSFYWGRYAANNTNIWMGYNLEHIETQACGELYRIKGLITSDGRIAPEITSTNLTNSLVLFTVHINQYTKREKRPTPYYINQILTEYI